MISIALIEKSKIRGYYFSLLCHVFPTKTLRIAMTIPIFQMRKLSLRRMN